MANATMSKLFRFFIPKAPAAEIRIKLVSGFEDVLSYGLHESQRRLPPLGRRIPVLNASGWDEPRDGGVSMPFPMVHLSIARNILGVAHHIKEPGQFMLGSIAPDSVHFRPGFHSDMKKVSHLCVGDEKWGQVTDNAGWRANVLRFQELMRDFGDTDFVLGYCAHLLADIKHNVEIWTPFRLEHQQELDSGRGSALHREAAEVDFELYRTCPKRREMCALLQRAQAVDIPGMVQSLDIERAKSHLLYRQYVHREPVDVSAHRYVTVRNMTNFIADASREIAEHLGLVRKS